MAANADSADDFEPHRPLLEGIAYRMLGSLAEAQDVVQDTWLRWSRAERRGIESPRSWLVTTCSRIALDVLKSARKRRMDYVGTWLPEPFLESPAPSPDEASEVDDTVSVALMLALETLSPAERAAFLLHDVFGHGFEEVARILDKTPAACRKLASRARSRVQARHPRFEVSPEEHRRLLDAFVGAARSGDLDSLTGVLVEDVELHADGGGKVVSARKVIEGRDRVGRFLVKVASHHAPPEEEVELRRGWCNGAPALALFHLGHPIVAYSLDIDPGSRRIRRIFALRNPDKLSPLRGWY